MSSPSDVVTVTFTIDRQEQARRGRLGGLTTHARHDSAAIAQRAREGFEGRFTSEEERRAYFSELGRRSAVARRARAANKGGAR